MDTLPPEVILYIIKSMSSRHWLNLALVSKQFNNLCPINTSFKEAIVNKDLYSLCKLSHYKNFPLIKQANKSIREYAIHLILRHPNARIFRFLIERCKIIISYEQTKIIFLRKNATTANFKLANICARICDHIHVIYLHNSTINCIPVNNYEQFDISVLCANDCQMTLSAMMIYAQIHVIDHIQDALISAVYFNRLQIVMMLIKFANKTRNDLMPSIAKRALLVAISNIRNECNTMTHDQLIIHNNDVYMILTELSKYASVYDLGNSIHYNDISYYVNYNEVCNLIISSAPFTASYIYIFKNDVDRYIELWDVIFDAEYSIYCENDLNSRYISLSLKRYKKSVYVSDITKRAIIDSLLHAVTWENIKIIKYILGSLREMELIPTENIVETISLYCKSNRNCQIMQLVLDKFPEIKKYTSYRRFKNIINTICKEEKYMKLGIL